MEFGLRDTFVIALDANPTTGYSWEADPNADVEFVKSTQVQGSSNAIGAPGTLDGTALRAHFDACIAKNPIQLGKP